MSINKKEMFISTIDNPFNYFNEFEKWLSFDELNGHNTLSLLARLLPNSIDNISDELENIMLDDIINKLVEENNLLYKKIYNK